MKFFKRIGNINKKLKKQKDEIFQGIKDIFHENRNNPRTKKMKFLQGMKDFFLFFWGSNGHGDKKKLQNQKKQERVFLVKNFG